MKKKKNEKKERTSANEKKSSNFKFQLIAIHSILKHTTFESDIQQQSTYYITTQHLQAEEGTNIK